MLGCIMPKSKFSAAHSWGLISISYHVHRGPLPHFTYLHIILPSQMMFGWLLNVSAMLIKIKPPHSINMHQNVSTLTQSNIIRPRKRKKHINYSDWVKKKPIFQVEGPRTETDSGCIILTNVRKQVLSVSS